MVMSTVKALLAAEMSFAERAGYGGKMLVIGMATVFSVLLILMLVLLLFKLFAYTIPNKAKAGKKVEPKPEITTTPVATVKEDSSDEELIAVITAAVEAFRSSNDETLPFRVVSFNRKKGASGWSTKAENENY